MIFIARAIAPKIQAIRILLLQILLLQPGFEH